MQHLTLVKYYQHQCSFPFINKESNSKKLHPNLVYHGREKRGATLNISKGANDNVTIVEPELKTFKTLI